MDAIAILRGIVGIQSLTAEQKISADFDRSGGNYDLNDAISILKHVVGLPSPDPEWVFVDKADGQVIPAEGKDFQLTLETTIELIGILRGDVDGSWTA